VHQNSERFNPHRHRPESMLPPEIARVATSLCCRRCQLIIRWKLDYGKYPSLPAIRSLSKSCNKSVTTPFHRLCQDCAAEFVACAKCQKSPQESERDAADALRRATVDGHDTGSSSGDDHERAGEHGAPSFDDEPTSAPIVVDGAAIADARYFADDPPELQRLRGLDVSTLRARMFREREDAALHDLNAKGVSERERRSALRKLERRDRGAPCDAPPNAPTASPSAVGSTAPRVDATGNPTTALSSDEEAL